ncbi:MAG: TDT family transporter [Psittacicella sp.]
MTNKIPKNNIQPILQKEIGPNWFASVMGTAIVANASAGVPFIGYSIRYFGFAVWLISLLVLVLLSIIMIYQSLTRSHIAKRHFLDPVLSQFWGAPPMGYLAVAGGTIIFGHYIFPERVAIDIAWVLFLIGTISGVIIAVVIPYLTFTKHEHLSDSAFGGWLMPVVSPMVSATIGSMFIVHMHNLLLQQTLVYMMYACFGLSLIASIIIITLIWNRLAHSGSSGGSRVPTLWIVLGPLGQSITATGALGAASLLIFPAPINQAFFAMGILYGVPIWGFAFLWFCIASLLTLRAIRRKMGFALTWWAFTFPVGTCVTGTIQLWLHTHIPVFEYASLFLFAFLLFAWMTASFGTIQRLPKGHILHNQINAAPVKGSKN